MLDAGLAQQIGIPAAIIFTLMGAAIRWLLVDRERLLSLLDEANADRMSLREKRAADLERAAVEYREFGEAQREVMREWTQNAATLLQRQEREG